MRARRGAAAVILGAAMLLAGGAARAETATCEIPIVHALPGSGSGSQIDPKIDRLRSYFSQAPFTAWHEFKLIDRKTLTLQENTPVQFDMPNSRPATLTFLGHSAGPGDHRMRLRLWIDHPEKKHRTLDTTFVLDEGGVVLHVGQKHEGGVLILAVSCKTHD